MWYAIVLFILFSPGVIANIPPTPNGGVFLTGQTSLLNVLVHAALVGAIVYYYSGYANSLVDKQCNVAGCKIKDVYCPPDWKHGDPECERRRRVRQLWPVIIFVALFILLTPGVILSIPAGTTAGAVNYPAVLVHALVFASTLYFVKCIFATCEAPRVVKNEEEEAAATSDMVGQEMHSGHYENGLLTSLASDNEGDSDASPF